MDEDDWANAPFIIVNFLFYKRKSVKFTFQYYSPSVFSVQYTAHCAHPVYSLCSLCSLIQTNIVHDNNNNDNYMCFTQIYQMLYVL